MGPVRQKTGQQLGLKNLSNDLLILVILLKILFKIDDEYCC